MKRLFSKMAKKKRKVEFCQKNLDRFLKEEDVPFYEEFFNNPTISYNEYQCQNKCGICKKHSYAMVNGQMILADSTKELLEKLKEIV
jgi:uncharacterized protein YuzB (UPF0349 family)